MLAHTLMLRASAEANRIPVELRAVVDAAVDAGVPGGRQLTALAEAVVHGIDTGPAREAVADALGSAALIEAAGVIGTFEMMNRIADGTGMPVGRGTLRRTEQLRARLGLEPPTET